MKKKSEYRILSLDTTTEYLNLALLVLSSSKGVHDSSDHSTHDPTETSLWDNPTIEEEFTREKKIGLKHSENLMREIDSLIEEASQKTGQKTRNERIDLLVVSHGPGSFTGIRIGLNTIKGLSMGWQTPFVTVPSLDILAEQEGRYPLLVLLTAKPNHYYFGLYDSPSSQGVYGELERESLKKRVEEWRETYEELFLSGSISRIEELGSILSLEGVTLLESGQILSAKRLALTGFQRFLESGAANPSTGALYLRKSEAEIVRERKGNL